MEKLRRIRIHCFKILKPEIFLEKVDSITFKNRQTVLSDLLETGLKKSTKKSSKTRRKTYYEFYINTVLKPENAFLEENQVKETILEK